MKELFSGFLEKIFEPLGIGGAIVLIGLIIVLISLGMTLQIGITVLSMTPGVPVWPVLVTGIVIVLFGIGYIYWKKREILPILWKNLKFPPILRAKPIQNILKTQDALINIDKNLDYFKKFVISVELSHYIGELATYHTNVPTLKLSLNHIRNLLKKAKDDNDEWLRCNAIELAGNGGILALHKLKEDERDEIVDLITEIQKEAEKAGQNYVIEVAHLKLGMLSKEREHIEWLIDSLGKKDKSFYEQKTFDDPVQSLHSILRADIYGPGRAYAAALLPRLIKDDEILKIEIMSAIAHIKGKGNADEYLVEVLNANLP